MRAVRRAGTPDSDTRPGRDRPTLAPRAAGVYDPVRMAADLESLRRRLVSAGHLSPAVAERVVLVAAGLLTAIEDLAALDLGDVEPPGTPSRR
jgi:hypothetical protein